MQQDMMSVAERRCTYHENKVVILRECDIGTTRYDVSFVSLASLYICFVFRFRCKVPLLDLY